MGPPRGVDVAVASLAICVLNKKKRKRKPFMWCKQWLLNRPKNTHVNLLKELIDYSSDYRNYLRMDEHFYYQLLQMVTPFIEKQDTLMRKAITPHERLAATLRFLATGRSFEDLKFTTCISPQALGRIIPETCQAIFQCLMKEYMKFPTTVEEWEAIAKEFEEKWQFPNCCGSVDGKHVAINPPAHSGSYFYNYKGFHSLVLMAVSNANYEFIYVHFGTNGRVSDGGVIACTDFYKSLLRGQLKLPPPSDKGLPYVFISDEAFSLREDFLKPYSSKALNDERRIFNYRLSRARRVVENAFGILVARFRVLKSEINLQPKKIESVVMACCALHNFLRRNNSATYTPAGSVDIENPVNHEMRDGLRANENLAAVARGAMRNPSERAKMTRDTFKDYFNNEGAVPWQDTFLYR